MARKPVNQHRMLTAVNRGLVSTYKSSRWRGYSWQIRERDALRPVTSAENMALDALLNAPRPMIEFGVETLSGHRKEVVLTDYGAITLPLWDDDMGPVPA